MRSIDSEELLVMVTDCVGVVKLTRVVGKVRDEGETTICDEPPLPAIALSGTVWVPVASLV